MVIPSVASATTRRLWVLLVFASASLWQACSSEESANTVGAGGQPLDASAPDTSGGQAGTGGSFDASVPDTSLPDAPLTDISAPDSTPPPDSAPDGPSADSSDAGPTFPPWSFAAVADPRENGLPWGNALRQIRDLTVNPAPPFPRADFILIAGDSDPNFLRYGDYKTTFSGDPTMYAYFPAMGNHDHEGFLERSYIQNTILPQQLGVNRRSAGDASYHVDWKNVRLIVVDQYADFGPEGCIDQNGRAWVDALIASAVAVDHVFVSFHEPAFPRNAHTTDSFNECPQDRDAFWDMLLGHGGKVKAVIVGHSHHYSRLRILDPRSAEANDPNQFPDQPGGIVQIDCGAAGNGSRNTVVRVEVAGAHLRFRVVEADNEMSSPFALIDEWQMVP